MSPQIALFLLARNLHLSMRRLAAVVCGLAAAFLVIPYLYAVRY